MTLGGLHYAPVVKGLGMIVLQGNGLSIGLIGGLQPAQLVVT